MAATDADKIEILQRFVNGYADDLGVVGGALGDASTPPAAQRLLIGALNYGLDMLDMFPDHYKGLGVADDAIVLRLASRLAVAAGATNPKLATLANEAADVATVFGDLVGRLERLVATFPDREVRGRTADKILGHKDTLIMFDADVSREAKRVTAAPIDTAIESPERAIVELRKMIESALQKAGIS